MTGLAGFAGIPLSAYVTGAGDVTFRVAHRVTPTHPLQVFGIDPWTDPMHEVSDGRIEVQIVPASRPGAPAEEVPLWRDPATECVDAGPADVIAACYDADANDVAVVGAPNRHDRHS